MQRSPSGFVVLLSSLDYFWDKPKEIVIAGDLKVESTSEIISIVQAHYLPNKILAYADPLLISVDESSIKLPVIEGKVSQDGQAKIFVCENYACQSPFLKKEDFKNFYRSLAPSKK